ncbi:MAG: low temperature requirement protein A [Acidimicrobiales bacterium]
MRGLTVPEATEDFTADPVELFFDLAFVFAFSQLVHMLIVHPDWEHIGQAALVFMLLWLPWTQFTWSANAVAGNQRSVRLLFLIATAASVPMAAAVESAFDGGGPLFAIPLAVIHVMAIALIVTSTEAGETRTLAIRYALPNVAAMVVLVVGGFLQDSSRIIAWVASILIVVWATVRAGQSEWVFRPGHFAERHGLILIVALGEVIVALGNAVVELNEGDGFSSTAIIALVATGVAAGVLWWSYFDRVQPALEHRAEALDGPAVARFGRDAYTYAHAAIVAGVILTAVGLEEAALHPDDPLPLAFRSMLFAGIALFIGGIAIAVYRAFGVIARERLAAVGALALVLVLGANLDAVWLVVVLVVLSVVGLVFEHIRIESTPNAPTSDPSPSTG